MVMHHLLFPGTKKSLEYLASLYCSNYIYWKDESDDWNASALGATDLWNYNCTDTSHTYDIAQVLKTSLGRTGKLPLYHHRLTQWRIAREMMLRGILFDRDEQHKIRLDLYQQAEEISNWLLACVPPNFQYTSTGKPWFSSPKATADLLYKAIGLTPILHKKTKQPTTDYDALDELANDPKNAWLVPLLHRLQDLRSIEVLARNFLSAKPGIDSRMRCTFNIAHPETFRWSSSKNGFDEGTNLQNIPKSTDD
jgi:DNA polymerase I-like protein with 3'-5' exonuclease and polymerase domains